MFGFKRKEDKEEGSIKVLMHPECKKIAKALSINPDAILDRAAVHAIIFATELTVLQKNTLMIGYDAELYAYMQEKESIRGHMYYEMRKKMKREFGLSDKTADWCVDMWSKIYAGKVLGLPIEDYIYTEDFRRTMRAKLDNRL
ncbi:MAG: hypothetical protein Q4B85_08220 [Lachnospiraceae bacterium]|nr:hypothetical protein [Lachnospiraceae bacterium]